MAREASIPPEVEEDPEAAAVRLWKEVRLCMPVLRISEQIFVLIKFILRHASAACLHCSLCAQSVFTPCLIQGLV